MAKPNIAKLDLATLGAIPSGIWTLGFVSLLMDVSSEMIHALLPIYLVTVLGTSTLVVGIIEGIAEATASITKLFSGALSDWLGKRKLLAAIGYGLAAFTKPVFPLATGVSWLIAARFIDRVGKGIRGAPRDALVADISPVELRGASFGLRQALDTIGAFTGPLLAIVLMWLLANDIKAVFWFAVVPAFLSMFLIIFGVAEPERPVDLRPIRFPLRASEIRRLGSPYWFVIAIATMFTMARFSEAFLILRAQSVGLAIALVPAVLVVMNVFYALAAYPAGVLSDNGDRTKVLAIGVLLLVAADLILGQARFLEGAPDPFLGTGPRAGTVVSQVIEVRSIEDPGDALLGGELLHPFEQFRLAVIAAVRGVLPVGWIVELPGLDDPDHIPDLALFVFVMSKKGLLFLDGLFIQRMPDLPLDLDRDRLLHLLADHLPDFRRFSLECVVLFHVPAHPFQALAFRRISCRIVSILAMSFLIVLSLAKFSSWPSSCWKRSLNSWSLSSACLRISSSASISRISLVFIGVPYYLVTRTAS